MKLHEHGRWLPIWQIDRFDDPHDVVAKASINGEPMERLIRKFRPRYLGNDVYRGNLLLNEGINLMWGLVCGAGGTAFNNANAYIGVGASAAVATAVQTGLQDAVNQLYKAMDGSYPLAAAGQQEVWRSTFGSADANFAWNEITVANGNSDAAVNLNRLVQVMGTKASGATWIPTLTITLA